MIVAETAETVTLRRADYEALVEDLTDAAAAARHRASEERLGWAAARSNYLTIDEAERIWNGTSRVQVWREKRGIGLRDLARQARMSPAHLSMLETGQRSASLATLRRLATILGTTIDALVA
jgi:ribosome-binding protein aMBF1 (putative translation factor)